MKDKDAKRVLDLFKKWARESAEESGKSSSEHQSYKDWCRGRADAFAMAAEMLETMIEISNR